MIDKKYLIIVDDNNFVELPIHSKETILLDENLNVTNDEPTYVCKYNSTLEINDTVLADEHGVRFNNKFFQCVPNEATIYNYPENHYITVGSEEHNDIYIPLMDTKIVFSNEFLNIDSGDIYLNGEVCSIGRHDISSGDYIYLVEPNIKIIVQSDCVKISSLNEYRIFMNYILKPDVPFESFPIYKRSPRIIQNAPTESITLAPPPAKPEKEKGGLIKLIVPPLVMLTLTIVVMMIQPRGIYAIIGIASTLTSLIFTVTGYFTNKKDAKEKEEKRIKNYQDYIFKKRGELYGYAKGQKNALDYHYPSVKNIEAMVVNYDSRIYERSAYDNDFLTISLGTATANSSYSIKFDTKETDVSDDELVKQAKEVHSEFREVKNIPVVIDLKNAHLGLVGEKKHIHHQLHSIITQIAFFQSYHDIEIVMLFEPEYRKKFEWLRWLSHFKLKAINVVGLIDSENTCDQVLNNLNQVLKQRKVNKDEDKKEKRFLPHYVFIIDDPKLIINHSIMEHLGKDEDLGFSLIYTTNIMSSLPENIKTVLSVGDAETGILKINEGRLEDKKISFSINDNINFENISRKLAPLEHIQGISTQIPESITFFEMYKVGSPKEFNSPLRWKKSESHKTLGVPLGVRGENDYVELNLHEKAHGPHGLVAGTTGSGKSEIVQSYILSLAVNFHPYEVGFLLIDYKGGGMAALFKNLPHLLGMITNLDGSESMRAMASIKSELSRRQQLFNDHNVNHINQYNQLFKSGEADKPLPHLFLISDEFAELKKEQPEFMSELVSAARIGRSLGIHLILATQKPSGVVDDQIWSNSRFKLALKVQNASDSNEVLKTPDAANITQPGRAYLQVGNNEIYELFQSAWSGAAYSQDDEKDDFDERVYLINTLGQRQLVGTDLSGYEEKESRITQLDATVDYLKDVFDATGNELVDKPWYPPLNNQITSPYFEEIIDVSTIETLNSEIPMGMVDIPEEQLQKEFIYDFTEDGNMAIFGTSTAGKSVTLTTLLLTAAAKNSPDLLNYYILDFGNSSLAQLNGLPHTADYIGIDDQSKLEKIIKLLEDQLAERKAKLASKNAINFSMYNSVSEDKIPALLLIVDNYDVVKEFEYGADDFFIRLSRDGQALGMFMIVTATRFNAIKYSMINNFKTRIAHYLLDKSEYNMIIGRPPYELSETPGRAFVKLANVNMMQIYTSVQYESDIAYINAVGQLIDDIKSNHSGKKAKGVKMLPEILTMPMLLDDAMPTIFKLPIGLDRENVEVQYLDLSLSTNLILGPPQSGKTSLLKILIGQMKHAEKVCVVDSKAMELYDCSKEENIVYSANSDQMKLAFEFITEAISEREQLYESSDKSITPRVFYSQLKPIFVVIDDIDNFVDMLKVIKAEKIVASSILVGVTYVGANLSSRLRGFDETTKLFKESMSGIVFGLPSEQLVWSIDGMRKYKPAPDGALIYERGSVKEIKIPRI